MAWRRCRSAVMDWLLQSLVGILGKVVLINRIYEQTGGFETSLTILSGSCSDGQDCSYIYYNNGLFIRVISLWTHLIISNSCQITWLSLSSTCTSVHNKMVKCYEIWIFASLLICMHLFKSCWAENYWYQKE